MYYNTNHVPWRIIRDPGPLIPRTLLVELAENNSHGPATFHYYAAPVAARDDLRREGLKLLLIRRLSNGKFIICLYVSAHKNLGHVSGA
jgi:hypothetical protein